MSKNISIKSGKLELVSSDTDIKLNSNTYIHLGSKEGVYIDVGTVGSDDVQNKVWINSPRIEFGLENLADKFEPVVKGDQLEVILGDILTLLNEIVSTPGAYLPQGQAQLVSHTAFTTNIIKQKLKRFKSQVTYTI
jgi:hypothetical protein